MGLSMRTRPPQVRVLCFHKILKEAPILESQGARVWYSGWTRTIQSLIISVLSPHKNGPPSCFSHALPMRVKILFSTLAGIARPTLSFLFSPLLQSPVPMPDLPLDSAARLSSQSYVHRDGTNLSHCFRLLPSPCSLNYLLGQ